MNVVLTAEPVPNTPPETPSSKPAPAIAGTSFAEWLEPRLGLLKSALTERAFVCFLTGRDYLEKLHRARQTDPHGILHTLFSDYFFIQYLPSELHAFVRSLLRHTPSPDAVVRAREERDLTIIPFLVLFRAQLQPIDVRRRLQDLLGATSEIELGPAGPGAVLGMQDRYELFGQVVIESVLEEPLVRARIECDSHFALLAIDAVYYVTRAWQRGDAELDVSDAAFTSYLEQRTQTTDGLGVSFPENDLRLLRSAMKAVVDRFVDPTVLRAGLVGVDGTIIPWFVERCRAQDAPKTEAASSALRVLSLLPQTAREALIARITGSPDRLRWQLDAHGRPLAAPDAIEHVESLCRDVDELRAVDHEMTTVAGISLDSLRESYGLFQVPNVTWAALLNAHRALKAAIESGSSYPAMVDDTRMLESYVFEVDAALPVIDRAVSLAHDLRGAKPFATALDVISELLKLKTRSLSERRAALEDAWREMREAAGITAIGLPPVSLDERAHLGMRFLWLATDHESPFDLARVEQPYWATWERRLMARVTNRSENVGTSWAEIAWAILRDRRPTLIQTAWDSNAASTWTQIALAAAQRSAAADGDLYPPWAAAAAFGVLGLSPLALAWGQSDLSPAWIAALSDGRSLPLALVVAERQGSPVWTWRIGGVYGALVVTEEQLEPLARLFEAGWRPLTDRHAQALHTPLLLVESGPTRVMTLAPFGSLRALAEGPWVRLWKRARSAWLVPDEAEGSKSDAEDVSSGRIVRGAGTVEEAAGQLFARGTP
jgi:hypothetical protein